MNSRHLITAVVTLAISTSAFAYRAPSGSAYRSQPRVLDNRGIARNDRDSDRSLKQAIKAKRKEAKQLRKAGDPRAAQSEQDLRRLQDQWRQTHGRSRGNRQFDDRGNRQFNDRPDVRDDDREGDRVHGKQEREHHDDGDRAQGKHQDKHHGDHDGDHNDHDQDDDDREQ